MNHKITTMFAFISTENEGGDEGIIATVTPSGIVAPMCGGEMGMIPKMVEHAEEMGLAYKIKYFQEVPRESILN